MVAAKHLVKVFIDVCKCFPGKIFFFFKSCTLLERMLSLLENTTGSECIVVLTPQLLFPHALCRCSLNWFHFVRVGEGGGIYRRKANNKRLENKVWTCLWIVFCPGLHWLWKSWVQTTIIETCSRAPLLKKKKTLVLRWTICISAWDYFLLPRFKTVTHCSGQGRSWRTSHFQNLSGEGKWLSGLVGRQVCL